MILHIIKCVPDQLGCEIYWIAIPIVVHLCLGFVSCLHTADIFSHLENSGGSVGRHLLFSLMGRNLGLIHVSTLSSNIVQIQYTFVEFN